MEIANQALLKGTTSIFLTTPVTHFYKLRLVGGRHMVMDYSESEKLRCNHLKGYPFRIAARDLLYVPFHSQDSTSQNNYVLTCTFRASCYSTHLSWAHTPVISWAVCLEQKVSTNPVRGE